LLLLLLLKWLVCARRMQQQGQQGRLGRGVFMCEQTAGAVQCKQAVECPYRTGRRRGHSCIRHGSARRGGTGEFSCETSGRSEGGNDGPPIGSRHLHEPVHLLRCKRWRELWREH
jgi:hypothetical protein